MKKALVALLSIPSLIPVFYIQGLAYHEGQLSILGISPGLYPLSVEQTLLRAYSFYVADFAGFLSLGSLLLVLLPMLSFCLEKISSSQRAASIFSVLSKPIETVEQFLRRHVVAALPGLVLVVLAYVLLAGAVLVVWPYNQARDRAAERLEQNLDALTQNESSPCVAPNGGVVLVKREGPANSRICGFVVVSSPSLLSLLTTEGVMTLNLGSIASIESSRASLGSAN